MVVGGWWLVVRRGGRGGICGVAGSGGDGGGGKSARNAESKVCCSVSAGPTTNLEHNRVVDVVRVIRDGRGRSRHADKLESTLRLVLHINDLNLKLV